MGFETCAYRIGIRDQGLAKPKQLDTDHTDFLKKEGLNVEEDRFLHNSHNLFYRDPFGAVHCRQKIVLRFMIKAAPFQGEATVCLHILKETPDGISREEFMMAPEVEDNSGEGHGGRIFRVEISAPEQPCLLWYYFIVNGPQGTFYYGNSPGSKGGVGSLFSSEPASYQITVYREGLSVPDWFQEAVMYQIFPDRFFNGNKDGRVTSPKKNSLLHAHWDNTPVYIREVPSGKVIRWDFFGGNLEGVRKKLAYLKDLGVTLLYFNPIFEAASNHRYDTGNYHKIDPMLGDEDLFRRLCAEAGRLGISIILDGVFSHTGSDSIYFNREGSYSGEGACQSADSPYCTWYNFAEYPNKYESWWGIDTLPNVNELDPSYIDFIITGEKSVLKHWMGAGIRGWRLDVADELPPEFLKKLHRELKGLDPEAILIGEVWEDASNKISYSERRHYLLGEELDGVTNYPLRKVILDFILGWQDAAQINLELMSLYENYPLEHFYGTMNMLGGHDVPRILTALGEGATGTVDGVPDGNMNDRAPTRLKKVNEQQRKRLKMAILWQLTFPGVPCIYYGDEAGLEGGTDPLNRGTYPWGEEDDDILSWYRTLIALRNHYDVLRGGYWKPLYAKGSIYSFARYVENETDALGKRAKDNMAIIILNRDHEKEFTFSLDPGLPSGTVLVDPLDDYRMIPLQKGYLQLTLHPLESRLLLQNRWPGNNCDRRNSGVLLHPTSLPSEYGIGDLGKGARQFLDFLAAAGQSYWQILPLNPPGAGESPYQCYSAFAGNPLLISLDKLVEDGLLPEIPKEALPSFTDDSVDFQAVKRFKNGYLEAAYHKFATLQPSADYTGFCLENAEWLEDYALFMSLKEHFAGTVWNKWEKPFAFREEAALNSFKRDFAGRIDYQKFLQFIFFNQWRDLKEFARRKGIKIIGDLPIFVSHDSCDVWRNPAFYELKTDGSPAKVAGVPPDYFSETGQMWGNPHYRWAEMEKDNYGWWTERFRNLFQLVDLVRIDHFRGFEAYWEIPAGEADAVNGVWVKGPGEDFFFRLQESLGGFPVIAEDLGDITPEVEAMKTTLGFPGMKVMQFMIEPRLDRRFVFPIYDKRNVLYTGTHDNDMILGWYGKGREDWASKTPAEKEEIAWYYIETAMHSDAETVIIPLQDILGLDSAGRMNIPGTADHNWMWRFHRSLLTEELAGRLKTLTEEHYRSAER